MGSIDFCQLASGGFHWFLLLFADFVAHFWRFPPLVSAGLLDTFWWFPSGRHWFLLASAYWLDVFGWFPLVSISFHPFGCLFLVFSIIFFFCQSNGHF